jgi:hypothetical protein
LMQLLIWPLQPPPHYLLHPLTSWQFHSCFCYVWLQNGITSWTLCVCVHSCLLSRCLCLYR